MQRALRLSIAVLALVLARPPAAHAQTAAPAVLAPLPEPAQVAAFGSIRVARFGNTDGATPVVLLPEVGAGPWEWAALIAHLAPGRAVYAVTFPGSDGLAAATPPLFPRVEADLLTMLARLNVDHPVLVGHGLGGMIALALAEQQPDRFAAVVPVDANPVVAETEDADYAQRRAMAAQAAAQLGTSAQFLAFVKKHVGPTSAIGAATIDAITAHFVRTDPAAFAQWASEGITFDARPMLARITVPIVAVVPSDSTEESQRKALVIKRFAGAKALTVDVLGPARSFVMLDQPEAFASVVDTLLRALP
jgi:pimeloyl-ACP methyl ester carboxylesterase